MQPASDTRVVTLPRPAVLLLLAAGRAVYQASQTVAQRGGTDAGLRHQWALADALTVTERAILEDTGE